MNIKELDHLRTDKRIRFAEETVGGETVTIVSYMIGDADLWAIPGAVECRGSVFDSNGECISRAFQKFFNVGENEANQVYRLQGRQFEVLEKRDGSMLTPVLINGVVYWKTKKSFYSEVAVEASKNMVYAVNKLAKVCLELGVTPIFEYTSPFNKIVLDYGDTPDFVLLALRDIKTGEYCSHSKMNSIAAIAGVKVIDKFDKTLDNCLAEVDTLTDFEGWCLRDVSTGFYCKLKTAWYLRNHRAQTQLRERDVADMVIDETIDDIKSALALDNFDLTDILRIESQVVADLSVTRSTVEDIVANLPDKNDFKEIAGRYREHSMFGLIMTAVRGKEPDYKKYWNNYLRTKYSLKCVYNKNF